MTENKLSTFERVKLFNDAFGVKTFDTPQLDVFTKFPKLVELRLSLIVEEVEELKEAVKNHDYGEVIDALADIKYVIDGAATSFGIDLDKAFDIVHESNMSKLCKTEEIAQMTVRWYMEHDTRYDSPAYRLSDDGKYYIVFNRSSGKILKSVEYTETDFSELIFPDKSTVTDYTHLARPCRRPNLPPQPPSSD